MALPLTKGTQPPGAALGDGGPPVRPRGVLSALETLLVSLVLIAGVTAWIAVVALSVAGLVALFVGAPVPSLVAVLVLVVAVAVIATLKANRTVPRRLHPGRS